jgi:hypothetical protein
MDDPIDGDELVAKAMAEDGVDVSDADAVMRWIAQQHADLLDAEDLEDTDLDDEEGIFGDDLFDLKEAFGLPDRLPPLRLPPESELAATARTSRLPNQAKQLAQWVGERREIEDGDLTAADASDAALALGMEVPEQVAEMIDLPDLVQLWELAEHLEFVELDEESASTGPSVRDWPDGADEDVLDIWRAALADTLDRTLVLAAELDFENGIDFTGTGAMLALMLFLARGDGEPLAELNEMIQDAVVGDLPPAVAEEQWQSWITKHGYPADALARRLADLGAVEVDDGVAKPTPLAVYAMRLQMLDMGVEVPLLPPVEEMTAADLVMVGKDADIAELTAESTAWLALREPDAAVAELLSAAAAGGPEERMVATSIATSVGPDAERHWREALGDQRLRPYAKIALVQFSGADPTDAPSDLAPTPDDLAWLVTDMLGSVAADSLEESGELVEHLADAVPAGQEEQVFDRMWRLDHPYAHDVLTLIGSHHPDKKIAKAARKAAFKVQPVEGR